MDESKSKLRYRHLTHRGMSIPTAHWTYDITKSYDWNYEFGPFNIPAYPARSVKPSKKFLSFKVNSLFGVPAGPLLNSRWIEAYSKLGYDILTYKTVRTRSYPAHQMPHILYVEKNKSKNDSSFIGKPYFSKVTSLAITNSFGVPSKDPDVWQEDVKRSLRLLDKGQLLILSIMGTQDGLHSQKEFIQDFIKCAVLAMETSAPVIEVNLSCPNLHGGGVVCYDVDLCGKICEQIKNVIGDVPLIAKIGYFDKEWELIRLLKKINPFIEAVGAINTLQGNIIDLQHKKIHMRQIGLSGVCGGYIKPYALNSVKTLYKLRDQFKMKFAIIGIGGVTKPEDFESYLAVGADAVQSATGAMTDPYLAFKIYEKQTAQKKDYQTAKTIGTSFFSSVSQGLSLNEFKEIYLQMIYPKTLPENKNTLLIREDRFKLKHGEKGRKHSHIYMNHRNPIFINAWDRRFLVELFNQLICERILKNEELSKNRYGVVAIPSSSSPELTASMLDSLTSSIGRAVVMPHQFLTQEAGAHSKLYGDMDVRKPWVLIDDVFTSGKTLQDSIKCIPDEIKYAKDPLRLFAITLISRNPDKRESFTKSTGVDLFSLVTLEEVLKYHWKRFTSKEKKLILKERSELH